MGPNFGAYNTSTPAGEVHYVDDISLQENVGSPQMAASAVAPYGERPYASTLDTLTVPVSPESEAHAYIYENITVSPDISAAELYIYENVVQGTPVPVIWYITPTEAAPGDTVFIIGTGLGAFQATYNGRILFNNSSPLPVVWELIGADANAYGPGRQIVPGQNIVDPEHELVSFVVPQGSLSGQVKISTTT
jgi:hypothetical protein